MSFVDIKQQAKNYKKEVLAAIERVIDSGQFILGEEVEELESQLAEFVGVRHAITTSSGTDSLLIALMALDVGRGDEVITVSHTWISTVGVIEMVGARPVLVDIDPDSYLIDSNQIEKVITPRTKAIIPVSLYGQMPDFSRINALAEKHGLAVVEDGAQSFGASQKGKMSGAACLIGATSFFPSKTFGCYGDGGALFTDDDELAEKMWLLRNHGKIANGLHKYAGINGRMDTLQAAILLAKLPHFPSEVEARQKIAAYYSDALKECCHIPKVVSGNTHVFGLYTIRTPYRNVLSDKLEVEGIPTRIYYPKCLHQQPIFAHLGHKQGSLPESEKAVAEILSLPLHPWLTKSQQTQIIQTTKSSLCLQV